MITIGTSLFLIALGAILKFAVTASVAGIHLHVVGVILMIVGAVGLALGLAMTYTRRQRQPSDYR
jgi:Flp pilus assembly protein TadB